MLNFRKIAGFVAGALALALVSAGQANAAPARPLVPIEAPLAQGQDRALTLVHGWHCGNRYDYRWGGPRHPRACRNWHRYDQSRYQRNRSNRRRNDRTNRGNRRGRGDRRGRRRNDGPVHTKKRTRSYREYKDKH